MQPIFLSCRLLTLWTSYLDSLLNRCAVSCCSTSIQFTSSILVIFPSICFILRSFPQQEGIFRILFLAVGIRIIRIMSLSTLPLVSAHRSITRRKVQSTSFNEMIVRFLPEHCASDSNAAEQKSKSALFSLIVLLPRGRGSVSQSGGSSLELETKVAEDYAKCYNHGEGPSRGLLRDYEPSDSLRLKH